MTVTVNMKELLEAGIHYGHQARRWNPRMKPYIFGVRNGIHIIDLQKTVRLFQKSCDFLENLTARRGHVLFIGTKKQARELVAAEARRAGMYFVNYRWLGGTLTNFSTIRQSIHRLKRIEKMAVDGTYDKLPKKEVINLEREKVKLEQYLGGIKDMPGLPKAIFIVDAMKESIAIKEANRLGIPVVAIVDTNSDPTGVDYVIPGNDDSQKSLTLIIKTIAECCLSGKSKSKEFAEEDKKYDSVSSGSFYDDSGRAVAVEKAHRYDEDKASARA